MVGTDDYGSSDCTVLDEFLAINTHVVVWIVLSVADATVNQRCIVIALPYTQMPIEVKKIIEFICHRDMNLNLDVECLEASRGTNYNMFNDHDVPAAVVVTARTT
eukprot:GILK01016617.1.p2 GENE.GILK01016617.1~~GILK01016617.1.p2  ORF type:complete len:105 (-),score=7.68 GILK01016617.1:24-338(-)